MKRYQLILLKEIAYLWNEATDIELVEDMSTVNILEEYIQEYYGAV